MRGVVRSSLLYIGLVALSSQMLFSQGDRGIIAGTISDSTGAAIVGARIVVTQVSTNIAYQTGTTTSGDFTVPSLPAGVYQIRVESTGFKSYLREGVQLATGGAVRIEARMELGSTHETIDVKSDAQMLETATAQTRTQVSNKFVEDLPLVVGGGIRSPFDLAVITPEAGGGGTDFHIGGGQKNNWGVTLDGISSNNTSTQDIERVKMNTPSVDAITEFAVESGGSKAEFGHAGGGSVVFVSKSGENQYHGTVYEFLRNDALDSRGFFESRKRVYKQHNFGVTAGGPIWIPKLYRGKDRTFFFLSYEGFRNRVGATPAPLSVAPPEFYSGDLRNWVDQQGRQIAIYDPANTRQAGGRFIRDPFPNNQIPQTRFDSFSKIVAPYGAAVKPNVPDLIPGTSAYVRNNYISNGVELNPANKFSTRIDEYLSSRHHLAGYYGYTRQTVESGADGPPGLPGLLSTFTPGYKKSDVFRFSWDYTISPTILNRFYAGGNNYQENQFSIAEAQGAWKDKVCMKNVPDCNINMTQVTFGDFSNWVGNADNGSGRIIGSVNDDITWISGKHAWKAGYRFDRSNYNGTGRSRISGSTVFNRLSTSIPLDTNTTTGGGSGFASFLLGEAYSGDITTPRNVDHLYLYHVMYLQDDWRVSRRLTLNLGLRYEFNLPPRESQDRFSELDLNLPNPAADGMPGALVFAGFGPGRQNTRTLVSGWYGGIGPHAGFSYAAGDKTVIRGSFARGFGALVNSAGTTHNIGFAQILNFPNTSQGLTRTFKYEDGMPAWQLPPVIDPSFGNGASVPWWQGSESSRLPEELDVTLNIQRQLGPSLLLDIGYHAANGAHLQSNLLAYNQVDYRRLPANVSPFTAAGRTLLNSDISSAGAVAAGVRKPFSSFQGTVAQSLRPFPQFADIDTAGGGGDRGGHSTYHALVIKLNKRYSSGLTLQASYVFSKLLTDADFSGSKSMDHYNRSLEKSIASYDQPHNLKLSYVYELPFGPGRRFLSTGAASRLLGGWRLGVIQRYLSGTPLDLATTIQFPIFGGVNRPQISTYEGWRPTPKGSKFDPNVDGFLQPASFFGPQPTDRFGNMTRRNPKLRYQPDFNENISLARSVHLWERARVEIRAEAFNLLNRTRFTNLTGGTTLQNFNFGLWRQQANDSRRMQVALKLSF